jgi:hypothetical protein
MGIQAIKSAGIKPGALTILSDPTLIEARRAGFRRLEALFAGETPGGDPLGDPVMLNGINQCTENDDTNWEKWLDESLLALASQADKLRATRVFRPLCITYNPHGVHFTDHLFGAHVFRMDDGSWQVHTLNQPVGTLQPPDLDHLPAWQVMVDFARAFLQREAPAVIYGMPTIASVLNIAVNLFGQEILLAMKTDAAAARHDLEIINNTLRQMHRWYRENIPAEQLQCIVPDGRCQPVGYGQLCGCTTQLVSAAVYREFIAPLDDALLSDYPHGGMIHLCGTHTQHIPVWREMKSLRAVQVNDRAAEDLSIYFSKLRGDQVFYVNPCSGMSVNRILEISKGRRVVIVADAAALPSPPVG